MRTPGHRLIASLGKRGNEKGWSGSEERAAVRNPGKGGEGKDKKDGKEVQRGEGSAWVTLEERSVCPRSVQWDPGPPGEERPQLRCPLGGLPRSPPHHDPLP